MALTVLPVAGAGAVVVDRVGMRELVWCECECWIGMPFNKSKRRSNSREIEVGGG